MDRLPHDENMALDDYDITGINRLLTDKHDLRWNGSWDLMMRKTDGRVRLTQILLFSLFALSLTALVFAGLIRAAIAHDLTITAATPCELPSGGFLKVRTRLHWQTDSTLSPGNDRAMLNLAIGFMAPAVLFFSVGFLGVLQAKSRFRLALKGSWNIIWILFTFVFGSFALVIGMFATVWAGSGFSEDFDASIQCAGQDLVDALVQSNVSAVVPVYAIWAGLVAMVALFVMVAALLRIYTGTDSRGTFSAEHEVLTWLRRPLADENGTYYAPSQARWDDAMGKAGQKRVEVCINGKTKCWQAEFADIDYSPNMVLAIWAARHPGPSTLQDRNSQRAMAMRLMSSGRLLRRQAVL
jgi:hypothetical protein